MRTFIIRPFGVKGGIDFERVEQTLIRPALKTFDIEGTTTQVFAQAGNIRTDMFEQLMLADLVIADISIHNANVYYELGVRHALRDRHTILIRTRQDEVPFDLKTDRYLEYPSERPEEALALLEEAVRQTLAATRPDSPVFLMVSSLKAQDPEDLLPAPALFVEAVERARSTGDRGMLSLLAEEIASLDWALQGWRVVGGAQVRARHYAGARATWEQVRSRRPEDVEANLALATVYQRLGDLSASSAAIQRALRARGISKERRAEARALVGSNLKALWAAEWQVADPTARARTALVSGHLYDAWDAYWQGFLEDQNHFYSGLNALALVATTLALATQQPDVWAKRFDSDQTAAGALERLQSTATRLTHAVRQSLDAAAQRDDRAGVFDIWRELSEADFALLTSSRPAYVARKYGDARRRLSESAASATGQFPADAAARQVRLYLELGVFVDNSRAAIAELAVPEHETPAQIAVRQRVVVFSGHRADKEGRTPERFPARQVDAVRQRLKELLTQEREQAGGAVEGIAGAASGGDLLFHEACAELGISSTVLLVLPPDKYVVESVQDGGYEWVERFRRLCQRVPPLVLGDSKDVPSWLSGVPGYTIWQRSNMWTLSSALARENADVTMVLLWDGKDQGDGPGGTADMVALGTKRGVKVLPRIDPLRPAVS